MLVKRFQSMEKNVHHLIPYHIIREDFSLMESYDWLFSTDGIL